MIQSKAAEAYNIVMNNDIDSIAESEYREEEDGELDEVIEEEEADFYNFDDGDTSQTPSRVRAKRGSMKGSSIKSRSRKGSALNVEVELEKEPESMLNPQRAVVSILVDPNESSDEENTVSKMMLRKKAEAKYDMGRES